MKPVTIFTGASGINVTVDPARLRVDADTGISPLAEAANLSIDDSARAVSRPGYTRIATGSYHSVFSKRDGFESYVVVDRASDSAIMRINTDRTLTGIRDGLDKGALVSFCRDGSKTWYSNGQQNGYIEDGISRPWPDQSTHIGQDTSRKFLPAPAGKPLAVAFGRMWIGKGDAVFYSEPFMYGKFDVARSYFQLKGNIRMICPVMGERASASGLWISDDQGIWFVSGPDPSSMEPIQKTPFPVLSGSLAHDQVLLPMEGGVQINMLVCACQHGVFTGTSTGEWKVFGKEKLLLPADLQQGASLVFGAHNIITHMRG